MLSIDFDLELSVSADYEVHEAEPDVGDMMRYVRITEVWAGYGIHRFNIIGAIDPAVIRSWEMSIEEGL